MGGAVGLVEAGGFEMSEMVERVAKALCRQCGIEDGCSSEQADRAANSDMYLNFCAAARAAIEAMREPTEDMLWHLKECASLREEWYAMIDEALK